MNMHENNLWKNDPSEIGSAKSVVVKILGFRLLEGKEKKKASSPTGLSPRYPSYHDR